MPGRRETAVPRSTADPDVWRWTVGAEQHA
jgi:hypothetical protein